MVDFDELRNKAEELLEEHADQVDSSIDKAAGFAEEKYGHAGEIDAGADKLKEFLPGGEDEERPEHRPGGGRGPGGSRPGPQNRQDGGAKRAPGRRGGQGRPGGPGKPAGG